MTDDRQARRRQQGRERQARFRKAHQGEFRTIQIPKPLHAALKTRARAAGLPLHRYLQLRMTP
ncbi:hypothetical protein [Methyloparacoccus murrellii]